MRDYDPGAAVKAWIVARIREDRRDAPSDVVRLLEAIEQHLFDPSFGIGRLRRLVPADAETFWRFRERFRLDAGAYIDRRRYEAALRLLTECDRRIADVAASLGHRNPISFSKWIKRRTGRTPSEQRAEPTVTPGDVRPRKPPPHHEIPPQDETPPNDVDTPSLAPPLDDVTVQRWRQAVVGALEAQDAAAIVDFLRRRYDKEA